VQTLILLSARSLRLHGIEVDTEKLLTNTEVIAWCELDIASDPEKRSIRGAEVDKGEAGLARRRSRTSGGRAVAREQPDRGVTARQERVFCEHHISRLTSEHGLHFPNVVHVARDPFDSALTEASVPWSGRRAKQERAVLLSRPKSALGLLEDIEAQDLLSDEDEIVVDEGNGHLGILRAPAWRRISGGRQAQVNAVGAAEIAERELPAVEEDADVSWR
jgi:hypothetical protein